MIIETSNPTFFSATTEWLTRSDGIKNLALDPTIKLLDWKKYFFGLSNKLRETRHALSRSKYAIGLFDLSRKWKKLKTSIHVLDFGRPVLEVTEKSVFVFKNTMSLAKMSSCTGEILHDEGVISLTTRQLVVLKTVGIVGCFATFLKTLFDIKKIIYDLQKTYPEDPARRYDLLQLVKKICVLICSVLAMMAFALGGEVVAKWVILSLSTASLSLSISKYYYKKLYLN